jgi:hypothetical protein
MHSLPALVLLGAALVSTAQAAIGPDCTNGPLKSNKICDKNASPAERAAALVAAMQTSEKLDNLMRFVLVPRRKITRLTNTANLKEYHGSVFQHTTGGAKPSTALLVLRVSISQATTRPPPLFPCRS